ncbi:MAG: S9 family peptidase, partial [Anaerolineae bacterium]|nr:S9 family peptidase [Anaerolineae bacterium]
GEPRLIHQAKLSAACAALSADASTMVIMTKERSGSLDFNLLAFDVASGDQIAELWDEGGSIQAVGFTPGDARLLANTNQSGAYRPVIWNPRSGERIDLALDELDGEVTALDWSPDGKRILLSQMSNAVQRLYTYDLTTQTLTALDHPAGVFGSSWLPGVYFLSDEEIVAAWQSSAQPHCVIALDSHTGQITRELIPASEQPASRPRTSITFASSDGQAVQAWLITPEGEGPFPTIIHTHGGPFLVDTDVYYPSAMMWVDHGFAWCSVNYRGSTTFGKAFQDKILHDLGHWEVEDVVAAHQWLVENKIAKPDQVLFTGRSYGGFMTLMMLGKTPELWAGGMGRVAISDWAINYEDSSPLLQSAFKTWLGGTPDEQPERYQKSSPITYAENVRAPLLIIQGRNDTRTTARQIEIYEQQMRAWGKEIEVVWFEAGHMANYVDARLDIAHHQLMLDFALKVLGRA